jgi:hypothetical protein
VAPRSSLAPGGNRAARANRTPSTCPPADEELKAALEQFHALVGGSNDGFLILRGDGTQAEQVESPESGPNPGPGHVLTSTTRTKATWLERFLVSYARARYPGRCRNRPVRPRTRSGEGRQNQDVFLVFLFAGRRAQKGRFPRSGLFRAAR